MQLRVQTGLENGRERKLACLRIHRPHQTAAVHEYDAGSRPGVLEDESDLDDGTNSQALTPGPTHGCPYIAVGMHRALQSAIGLPSNSTNALRMLTFVTPADLSSRRNMDS